MDLNRKAWNDRQKALRRLLSQRDYDTAIPLFLQQHACVHRAEVSGAEPPTFEDEVWTGLTDAQARIVPEGEEHSIAWIFWHLTRIEDVTMNILLAESDQLFEKDGWRARLGTDVVNTGNLTDTAWAEHLSAAVDLPELRAYRLAVGQRTREIVQRVPAAEWRRKPAPERLQQLLDEGAVTQATYGLIEYWGGLTKAGLLLMPPTRHGIVHLSEALKIRKKVISDS